MDDLIEIGPVVTERKLVERVYRYVEINGKRYDLRKLFNELEQLENTSYGFVVVLIGDEIGDLLSDLDVAFKSVRGSYSRSENFDRFYRQIEKLYYGG